MPGLKKVAGSRLFIGGKVVYKSTVTLADFTGQTWVEVGGWAQAGSLGAEQEAITQTLLSQNTTLYSKGVISYPAMENQFVPDIADPGQIAMAAAQKLCSPYATRIIWGADCGIDSVLTITIASPGVVTWTAHGLTAGSPVTFATTGALPTGLTAGLVYYVVSPTANAFSVALTPGGAAIATTGTQSGVHTASAQEIGETDLFYSLFMPGSKSGGDASATRLLTSTLQPISNIVSI